MPIRLACIFALLPCLFLPLPVLACDSCAVPLARTGSDQEDLNKPFFFDFTFEQQRWEELDGMELHELHHDGHHVHYKTHEEYYHYTFGMNPTDRWTLLADLPYIVRHSYQVDQHSRVGAKEASEGFGDLKLTATGRFLKSEDSFLGVIGGIKLPTGSTQEVNPIGVRFEQELQPGSGSYDYIMGAAFQAAWESLQAHGNLLYTIKTEGAHHFEFGNALSSYVILDAPVYSDKAGRQIRLGVDVNLQIEEKQEEAGRKIADSGGTTIFMGPSVTIELAPGLTFFGNFLPPVYQDLGGIHQEIEYVWNAGGKMSW